MIAQPNLGDRCTLAAHPKAPPLTVALVYLQGPDEALWAGCSWSVPGSPKAKPQLVHVPVCELVTEGGA